jgi:hypothetical protein
MSTKTTLLYFESKDFMFHLYDCFIKGKGINIRFKDFRTTLLIDDEQAEKILKQVQMIDDTKGRKK